MRLSIVLASAVVLGSPTCSSASACAPAVATCLPAVVVFPAYTPEGLRIGTVEAPVRHIAPAERSRFTAQPLPVIYNNPGNAPGAIDPVLERVTLPHAKRFKTQAVYPTGY